MNLKTKYLLSIFSSVFILLFLYTFLHEGGHALIAVLCGGHVVKFVLGINAHVSIAGATFTPVTQSLFHCAGMLLPAFALACALLLYKHEIANVFYHCFYFMLTISIIGSILAWIIVPVVCMVAAPPVGDDVARFIASSGLHPLAVLAGSVCIASSLLFLAKRKGVFHSITLIIREMQTKDKAG